VVLNGSNASMRSAVVCLPGEEPGAWRVGEVRVGDGAAEEASVTGATHRASRRDDVVCARAGAVGLRSLLDLFVMRSVDTGAGVVINVNGHIVEYMLIRLPGAVSSLHFTVR